MSVKLEHQTAKEIREGGYEVAILPIGATEWHGDALPFNTDTLSAEGIAMRIAQDLGKALVLPPIAYGVSPHLLAWSWTVSIQPATLTAMIVDIAESLLAHGVTKLLVVTAHDGNPGPVESAARELQLRHGIAVAVLGGWQEMARDLLSGTEWDIDLDHGGQSEMSMVLHLAPDLAHPDRVPDLPRQKMDHPVRVFGPFSNVVPEGYSGAITKGSAAEGQAIIDAVAAHVVPFLRELDAHGWMNGTWMSGMPDKR